MSRRDTKVPLTKPLLGSRRHCNAGTTMTINDLNLLMGSAIWSFSMILVLLMHFVRVARTQCLTDSSDKHPTAQYVRVFSVGYRCTIYDTVLSVLQ